MRILGIADGPDASAALCVDDQLVAFERQASFDAGLRSRAFPWDAAVDVLRRAGCGKTDVRTIAIAGRFTPPLPVRQFPVLRRAASSAFSTVLDVGVFYQAMLRQTGMGALQADNAADWLAVQLGRRGYRGKLQLVDIHVCLANAVYRFQDRDDVLICTLHPMGDGVSLALHRAAFGQIDRVFSQKGFASLHVHLHRCAERLGCVSLHEMWTLAGDAPFDPTIVEALRPLLRANGDRLSKARYPLSMGRRVYPVLDRVDRAIGAASVRENLRQAVCDVLEVHLSRHDCRDLLLGGEAFADPSLVEAVGQLDGVRSVFALPDPGYGALAVGAAAYAAGLPMRDVDPAAVDPEVPGQPDVDAVREALWSGTPVFRISGRSVLDPYPTGDRCRWLPYDGGAIGTDERIVNLEGSHGSVARPGSVLDRVAQGRAVRLTPLRFAGKPVIRLSQVETLARSANGVVCSGIG